MASPSKPTDRELPLTEKGTTVVELAQRPDGTWQATQPGLDIVGTGESAVRATEKMAGRIADLVEAGDL